MLVLVLQHYLAKQQTSKSFVSSMDLDHYSHSVVQQKVLRSSRQQSVSMELVDLVQKRLLHNHQKILHNTHSVEMQSKNNWIITLDRESWTSSKVVLQLSLQKRRLPSVQMDLVSSHSLEQAPSAVNRPYIGSGSISTFSGQAIDEKVTFAEEETLQVQLSGESVSKFTGSFLGSGSLFTASGAAESTTTNPPEDTVLFTVSGIVSNSESKRLRWFWIHCYHWICRRKNSTTSCWYWFSIRSWWSSGSSCICRCRYAHCKILWRSKRILHPLWISSNRFRNSIWNIRREAHRKICWRYCTVYHLWWCDRSQICSTLQWIWFSIHCEWSGRIQDHQQTRKYSSLHIQWSRQRKTRQQPSYWKRYYHSQR